MTISFDIVERLYDRRVCSPAQNSCRNDSACEAAAIEIERLRKQVATANARVDKLTRQIGALRAEAFEQAAHLVEHNVIAISGVDHHHIVPRSEGDITGKHYADAIRQLAEKGGG